jgi:hypothetical protein
MYIFRNMSPQLPGEVDDGFVYGTKFENLHMYAFGDFLLMMTRYFAFFYNGSYSLSGYLGKIYFLTTGSGNNDRDNII